MPCNWGIGRPIGSSTGLPWNKNKRRSLTAGPVTELWRESTTRGGFRLAGAYAGEVLGGAEVVDIGRGIVRPICEETVALKKILHH